MTGEFEMMRGGQEDEQEALLNEHRKALHGLVITIKIPPDFEG
jgi:hypothetical protein